MENEPAAVLRRRRQALLRQFPPLKAILRGSLIERYKRCGKPGCKCTDGPGHGPKYYLSVSFPGSRPQMDYVSQESHARCLRWKSRLARSNLDWHRLLELCTLTATLLEIANHGSNHPMAT